VLDEILELYRRAGGGRLAHVETRRRSGSGAAGSVDDWTAIAFEARS
jgi:hypothetical protein